jgi:hypothetical protein
MMLPWRFLGLGVFASWHALLAIGCGGSTESEPPRCTSSGVPRWETVELPDDLPFAFEEQPAEPWTGRAYTVTVSPSVYWAEGHLYLWNCADGVVYSPSESDWQKIPPFSGALEYCSFSAVAGGDLVLWNAKAPSMPMQGRVFSRAEGRWDTLPSIPLGSSFFAGVGAYGTTFYVLGLDPWRIVTYDLHVGTWLEHAAPEWMLAWRTDVTQVLNTLYTQYGTDFMPKNVPDGTKDVWMGFDFAESRWLEPVYLTQRLNFIPSTRAAVGNDILIWTAAKQADTGRGVAFNPFTQTWRNMPTGFAPAGHIWSAGGQAVLEAENGWYLYDPRSDEWSTLPSECAPEPGRAAFVVWTDYGLLVWTGVTESNRRGYGRLLVLDEGNGWPQSGQ